MDRTYLNIRLSFVKNSLFVWYIAQSALAFSSHSFFFLPCYQLSLALRYGVW